MFVFSAGFPTANLTNASDRTKWVSSQLQHVMNNSYDGINVDFEDQIDSGRSDLKRGLTELMKELYQTFKDKLPNSQVCYNSVIVHKIYPFQSSRYYSLFLSWKK